MPGISPRDDSSGPDQDRWRFVTPAANMQLPQEMTSDDLCAESPTQLPLATKLCNLVFRRSDVEADYAGFAFKATNPIVSGVLALIVTAWLASTQYLGNRQPDTVGLGSNVHPLIDIAPVLYVSAALLFLSGIGFLVSAHGGLRPASAYRIREYSAVMWAFFGLGIAATVVESVNERRCVADGAGAEYCARRLSSAAIVMILMPAFCFHMRAFLCIASILTVFVSLAVAGIVTSVTGRFPADDANGGLTVCIFRLVVYFSVALGCIAYVVSRESALRQHFVSDFYREVAALRVEAHRSFASRILRTASPAYVCRTTDVALTLADLRQAFVVEDVIVGVAQVRRFADWSSLLVPVDVIVVLHELFCHYDTEARKRHVVKASTCGDRYIVVSGLDTTEPRAIATDRVVRFGKWQADIASSVCNIVLRRRYVRPRGITKWAMDNFCVQTAIGRGTLQTTIVGQTAMRFSLNGTALSRALDKLKALDEASLCGARDRFLETSSVVTDIMSCSGKSDKEWSSIMDPQERHVMSGKFVSKRKSEPAIQQYSSEPPTQQIIARADCDDEIVNLGPTIQQLLQPPQPQQQQQPPQPSEANPQVDEATFSAPNIEPFVLQSNAITTDFTTTTSFAVAADDEEGLIGDCKQHLPHLDNNNGDADIIREHATNRHRHVDPVIPAANAHQIILSAHPQVQVQQQQQQLQQKASPAAAAMKKASRSAVDIDHIRPATGGQALQHHSAATSLSTVRKGGSSGKKVQLGRRSTSVRDLRRSNGVLDAEVGVFTLPIDDPNLPLPLRRPLTPASDSNATSGISIADIAFYKQPHRVSRFGYPAFDNDEANAALADFAAHEEARFGRYCTIGAAFVHLCIAAITTAEVVLRPMSPRANAGVLAIVYIAFAAQLFRVGLTCGASRWRYPAALDLLLNFGSAAAVLCTAFVTPRVSAMMVSSSFESLAAIDLILLRTSRRIPWPVTATANAVLAALALYQIVVSDSGSSRYYVLAMGIVVFAFVALHLRFDFVTLSERFAVSTAASDYAKKAADNAGVQLEFLERLMPTPFADQLHETLSKEMAWLAGGSISKYSDLAVAVPPVRDADHWWPFVECTAAQIRLAAAPPTSSNKALPPTSMMRACMDSNDLDEKKLAEAWALVAEAMERHECCGRLQIVDVTGHNAVVAGFHDREEGEATVVATALALWPAMHDMAEALGRIGVVVHVACTVGEVHGVLLGATSRTLKAFGPAVQLCEAILDGAPPCYGSVCMTTPTYAEVCGRLHSLTDDKRATVDDLLNHELADRIADQVQAATPLPWRLRGRMIRVRTSAL